MAVKKTIPKKVTPKKTVAALPEMKDFPTIRKGSKETGYITLLQTNLKNRGYYDGPVDGKFGDRTEKAVMDFQKDLKKPLNGSVGPKTWEALQESTMVKISASTPTADIYGMSATSGVPGVKVLIEGLTRYQADLLVKLFQGHTECRILP